MIGADRALELLSRVVAAHSAHADGLEAVLATVDGHCTRFGCSTILQATTVSDPRVTFRALARGASAEATTSDLSPSGLDAACRHATRLAQAAGAVSLAAAPTLPGPDGTDPVIVIPGAYDEATARADPPAAAAMLARAFRQGERAKVTLAGRTLMTVYERAVVNSLGLRRYFASTVADARVFATDGQASGYSGDVRTSAAGLDVEWFVAAAIGKCVRGRDPVDVGAGRHDVILEPDAVADLVDWLGLIGFTPNSVEDGTSFLAGRIGRSITGDQVTLVDDGWCEAGAGIPTPFDREGVLKRKVVLIDRGVGRQVVHDTQSAARAGVASTGHAVAPGDIDQGGPAPQNLVFAAGDASISEMLASVERGLWVSAFHYVNGLLDPHRAVMTGLTRHGTFEIVNGQLGRSVKNLRFTDSVLEAFTRIAAVSSELRAVPVGWGMHSATVAPAVLIRGLNFSGESSE